MKPRGEDCKLSTSICAEPSQVRECQLEKLEEGTVDREDSVCHVQEEEKLCKSAREFRKAGTVATREPPAYMLESPGGFLNISTTSRSWVLGKCRLQSSPGD